MYLNGHSLYWNFKQRSPMGRPDLVHIIILRSNLKTRQTLLAILRRVFHFTEIAKLSSDCHALRCTWLPTKTGQPEGEQTEIYITLLTVSPKCHSLVTAHVACVQTEPVTGWIPLWIPVFVGQHSLTIHSLIPSGPAVLLVFTHLIALLMSCSER